MKYYKTTKQNRNGTHTSFQYPEIGEWTAPVKGNLEACENGYHFCTIEQLPIWVNAEIYEIEVDEEILECNDKCVARSIRLVKKLNWNEKTQRLFAADCAEHVLHVFEEKYPDDDRPRKAIEAARKFAYGKIRKKELSDAWAAACVAACGAACYAVYYSAHAAADAAHGAIYYAAADAAWAAATTKNKEAERKWQAERLAYYLYEFENGEEDFNSFMKMV